MGKIVGHPGVALPAVHAGGQSPLVQPWGGVGQQGHPGQRGDGTGDVADAGGEVCQQAFADALIPPAPVRRPVVTGLPAGLAEVEGGVGIAGKKGVHAVGVIPVGVGENSEGHLV